MPYNVSFSPPSSEDVQLDHLQYDFHNVSRMYLVRGRVRGRNAVRPRFKDTGESVGTRKRVGGRMFVAEGKSRLGLLGRYQLSGASISCRLSNS